MSTWNDEMDRLDRMLAKVRSRRDAAEPGTELYRNKQAEANVLNHRLTAYEAAQPVLAELYRQLATAMRSHDRYALQAREDAGMWARVAASAAGVGGLLLLIWAAWGAHGWLLPLFAILSVGLCVAATGAAVASHRDQPDTASSVQLRARIEAIEQACQATDSQDGVDHVLALLRPPAASTKGSEVAQRPR